MILKEMYSGVVNSTETFIVGDITATDTTIYVQDATSIPDAPNVLVLGGNFSSAETVKLIEKQGNKLTVQRAFQGTAKSWVTGTIIARNFTEYDYEALRQNVIETAKELEQTQQSNLVLDTAMLFFDGQTLSVAEPTTDKTVPYTLTGSQAVTKDYTYTATEPLKISPLSYYSMSLILSGLAVNTVYSGRVTYSFGQTTISVKLFEFRATMAKEEFAVFMPENRLTQLTDVAAGDKLTLSISLSKSTGGTQEVSILTGASTPSVFVRNGGGVSSNDVYDFDGVQLRRQRSINAEFKSQLATLTASKYVTYTVKIDENNSNPLTAVTYLNDAMGMAKGSSDWDSKDIFKDIKPCMLLNGAINYYLNPNNFEQKADGTVADITSGNDGDVMISLPFAGYKFERIGTDLYVSITNEPNKPGYSYDAFSRETLGDRDKAYVGAYLSWYDGTKNRSLSGKIPTANITIGTQRTRCQAGGIGYQQLTYGLLKYLQCLYLIKYGSLNSQAALGQGFTAGSNSAATTTGGANTKGMYFGEQTGTQQMKFAGVEDFWGNLRQWVDGLYIDASWNILTNYKNFNDAGTGYADNGKGAISNISGYITRVQGTNGSGFLCKTVSGSSSTYYTDDGYLYASCLPYFGGFWAIGASAGAFFLFASSSAASASSYFGGRLCFI